MPAAPASRLALYLAGAYTLLAVYGSLYPFAGWTDSGVPPLAFLEAGWPRYTTAFDISLNVAAYVPLGFLWFAALRPFTGRLWAPLAAIALGSLVSLGTETAQNFLPTRVPSNLDLACNVAGTLAGAVAGILWGTTLLDGGRLHALRNRHFHVGTMPDKGLLLIWLWLLTQFNPATLLFGNGDLRGLLDLPALPYVAGDFARIEAMIVGTNTFAIAMLISLMSRQWLPVPAIIGGALVAKSFAIMLLMKGGTGLAWATHGSLMGFAAGMALWLPAGRLHVRWRRALTAIALLLATILVNLAPENPYLANTFQVWNPGQFLNFHGLTRIASNLWPFLALPWVIMLREKE